MTSYECWSCLGEGVLEWPLAAWAEAPAGLELCPVCRGMCELGSVPAPESDMRPVGMPPTVRIWQFGDDDDRVVTVDRFYGPHYSVTQEVLPGAALDWATTLVGVEPSSVTYARMIVFLPGGPELNAWIVDADANDDNAVAVWEMKWA